MNSSVCGEGIEENENVPLYECITLDAKLLEDKRSSSCLLNKITKAANNVFATKL